jgi:hypothetical protein
MSDFRGVVNDGFPRKAFGSGLAALGVENEKFWNAEVGGCGFTGDSKTLWVPKD